MPTIVSAPGKVFLAGGYLVLDRSYTALVFGLNARIHVVVNDIDTTSGVELSEIVVQSPQFLHATWSYGYVYLSKDDGGIEVTQLQGSPSAALSKNIFVQTALTYALTYISSVLPSHRIPPASINIFADDDYYSNPPSNSRTVSSGAREFTHFDVRLQDANKTGLGSSAALVTAFTGAVLSHYLPNSDFDLSSDSGRAKLHNLAQAAHCAAQGKVGSGFDVATAVYGTCIYRRFSPSILQSLGEAGSKGFARRLKQLVDDVEEAHKWDFEISKEGVTIPRGMALVMCDVDCGSQTVGMVKKVLEWRKKDPDGAKELWDELQKRNEHLASLLSSGSEAGLTDGFAATREKIREMGEKSGVSIEPPEQTALLDAVTEKIEGVFGGVVPGAGGYDAITLLIRDDEASVNALNEFLSDWSRDKESKVRLLKVRGELGGTRLEDVAAY